MTTPVSSPSPAPGAGDGTVDPLVVAAETENAAIFTYGLLTAFVAVSRRRDVTDYAIAHRARRDEIERAIRAEGGTPPLPASGYTMPFEVTGPVSAARAALAAEVDCTVAYRALLEESDGEAGRRLAVDGLTECAVRAATWRAALQESPTTVAFPGSAVNG